MKTASRSAAEAGIKAEELEEMLRDSIEAVATKKEPKKESEAKLEPTAFMHVMRRSQSGAKDPDLLCKPGGVTTCRAGAHHGQISCCASADPAETTRSVGASKRKEVEPLVCG